MSLTQSEQAFVGAHEDGINDLITAFCTDRPRYLLFRSPAFGAATTVDATYLEPIEFPGIPGGIDWQVRLTIPQIDLFKQSMSLPPELSLGPGQFSGRLGAEICLDCKRIRLGKTHRPGRKEDGREEDDRRGDGKKEGHPLHEVTCWRVEVFLVGHIEDAFTSGGEPAIAFVVDQVEIVDIEPNELESLLECLLFMIVQAALAAIRLPSSTFAFDPFTPVVGPLIDDDHVKLRGNL